MKLSVVRNISQDVNLFGNLILLVKFKCLEDNLLYVI